MEWSAVIDLVFWLDFFIQLALWVVFAIFLGKLMARGIDITYVQCRKATLKDLKHYDVVIVFASLILATILIGNRVIYESVLHFLNEVFYGGRYNT